MWGAPAGEISMWIVGTNRKARVMNMPDELWAMFKKDAEDTRMVFGNFEMCPLTKNISGHRQDVCITKASNLSQFTKEQTGTGNGGGEKFLE
jgi:hypothetical protein